MSLILQTIGIAGNLISRIVFGNFLSEEEFGVYNILILMPNLLALLVNIGMGHAISIKSARSKIISINLIKIIYLYSLIIGGITSIVGGYIFQEIYNDIHIPLIIIGSTLTTIFLLNYLLSFLFLGLQKSNIYFLSTNLVHMLSPLIFIIIIIMFNVNIYSAVLAYSIALLLVTLFLKWKLYRNKDVIRKNEIKMTEEFKELASLGLPLYFTSLFNFLNYRIDTFIIGAMLSFALLSNYTIAVLFIDSVGKINQIINILIFQKTPTITSEKKKEKLMAQGVIISMFICSVASLILVIFGRQLISIIFPGKFELAYQIILYLIPGMFFISLFRIVYHRLAADGYGKYSSIGSLICVIFTIVFNLVLIPIYGITGSAIASSSAYFIMFLYIIFIYFKVRRRFYL